MAWLSNPIAFTRGPVTIITTLVYFVAITAVIITQDLVPSSPKSPTPIRGINLTEAWNDLQLLSAQYHPYNSRRNDFIHDWLLGRITTILKQNNASSSSAYVFEDNVSNLTYSSQGSAVTNSGISVYFEGTNIIVYIRGTDDDSDEWWLKPKGKPSSQNGVLVNAHYDSVSTGFGATDDGVGVISVLQLINYYTTKGNSPKNGLVMLLNNGEEDYLNGANVFTQHPMSRFPSSFLNLEGAGAGGRAAMFRSTDEEVTKAYARSPYPFGTVITGDAFERGLVRSQTDYVVFTGKLGLRGLDVAFIEPRARYHTDQDDSRHTSKDALWHMLSAAIATTQGLTKNSIGSSTKGINVATQGSLTAATDSPEGHPAIWFDIFGMVFILMQTHTFFALSVSLLVVGPILLLCTMLTLYKADKLYLFSSSRRYHTVEGDEFLSLKGWRGFFRFPPILLFACAAPVALAYLMFKVNPFIAHSSEWAVWSMMVSSFIFIAWFFCRAIDSVRPSALMRLYGLIWLCGAWWVFLVASTVAQRQFHIAGAYFTLLYSASLFLATFMAFLELYSVPTKSKYCSTKLDAEYPISESRSVSRAPTERSGIRRPESYRETDAEADENATETSSLLRNRGRSGTKKYTRSAEDDHKPDTTAETEVYHHEQEWSKPMWSWLWILEMLIIVPLNVIVLGQVALCLVAGLHQTGSDGSSMFIVYISMAILTIFIFSPLVPLLHRFTWHVPMFLLCVLIGTLLYNMFAFPFSSQNRLKLAFQQVVDLDNSTNTVSVIGLDDYVQEAISYIPSSAGQKLNCTNADPKGDRQKCSWTGIAPRVTNPNYKFAANTGYKGWVNYNVTLTNNGSETNTARFVLYGKNTRACKLVLDTPITGFHVSGQATDDKRFPSVLEGGSTEIRLWSRTWGRAWTVDVTWDIEEKETRELTGKVVCLWSDVNQQGVIPAFDEVYHFVPDWIAITKAADGLVEAYKRFKI